LPALYTGQVQSGHDARTRYTGQPTHVDVHIRGKKHITAM